MKPTGRFWVRVLLFTAVVPIAYVVLFLLPHYHHLVMNLIVIALAGLGARETERILARKGIPVSRGFFFFSATIPLVTYLEIVGFVSSKFTTGWLIGLVVLVLLRSVWVRSEQDIEQVLPKLSSSLLVLCYPSVLLSFLVRLTDFPRASVVLLFFFCLIFGVDTFAYLIGITLGGKSMGLAISPNKTAAGFVGGLVSGIGIVLIFKFTFKDFLTMGIGACVLFGLGIAILSIAGDLVESALKRSAGVKDSGRIIPGRGGVLDSVDSWMLSLPVFYFVLSTI